MINTNRVLSIKGNPNSREILAITSAYYRYIATLNQVDSRLKENPKYSILLRKSKNIGYMTHDSALTWRLAHRLNEIDG